MRHTARSLILAGSAALALSACKLTEEIRTRPGAEGPVSSPTATQPDGAFLPSRPDSSPDGAAEDGGPSADSSSAGGAGGRGGAGGTNADASAGGSGGRIEDSGAGNNTGAGGRNLFDAACPTTSGACQDYCAALPLAPNCQPPVWAAEGGVDPLYLAQCECECEAQYRNRDCRPHFDEFVACGAPFLMLTCEDGDELPVVSGECGAQRFRLQTCLEELEAKRRDAGSGGTGGAGG